MQTMTMRLMISATALAALLASSPAGVAKEDHRLVREWTNPALGAVRFHKILIIGIADLTPARRRFEDRFVVYLRGKNLDGVPSHELVPHLDRAEDRTAIVTALDEQGVDAAITIRLVPLDTLSEAEWDDAWRLQTESDIRIRGLIEKTLPMPPAKAKQYGVEVALWNSGEWRMAWAARSDPYKRKELEDEAPRFVQLTILALRDTGLLP